MRALLTCLGLLALSASTCTSREAPRSSAWTLQVTAVPSPADVASAEPQLTASEHGVILIWLENEASLSTLKFSERTATTWSAPRSIVAREDLFSNFADVPSVVRLADRTLVAHWMQQSGPHPESYDLQLSRSSDEGRTWSPAFSPHHDGTKSEHGFASLFEIRGAGLGLVWLDGMQFSE